MAKTRAGQLIHLCQFLKPNGSETDVTNTRGDITVNYTNDFTAWCRIEPLQGREQMVAQQMRADVTHKVTMYVNTALTHRHIFTYSGRTFYVGPTTQAEEYDFFYTFYAAEVRG